EISKVLQLGRGRAENQRDADRGRDRLDLGPGLGAGDEESIDPRRLIGLGAGDGVGQSGDADRRGSAGDDEALVLPAGAARILPTPSSIESSCGLLGAPKGTGRSVSSIERPQTPAISSSSTVRWTLSALP